MTLSILVREQGVQQWNIAFVMIPTQEEDFADILIKPVPGDLFRQYLYAALLLIQEMSKFVDPRMSSIASTTAQILIYIWTLYIRYTCFFQQRERFIFVFLFLRVF